MPPLKNARHEAFALHVARGMAASEAYEAAGYKPSRSAASRLSANVNIEARICELLEQASEKAELDIARVLTELSRLGLSDVRRAFDEHGNLKPVQDWDDELAAAISSVEVVSRSVPGAGAQDREDQAHGGALNRKRSTEVEYVHKLKLWDKNSALEKLAKIFGMYVDKLQLSGDPDNPVKHEVEIHIVDHRPPDQV